MKTYKTTVYEKSDIDKLENMTNAEIADVLDGIEGSWMLGMPAVYFHMDDYSECSESDYRLIEALAALSKAAEILRKTSEL